MAEAAKDTIYVDIDDDITAIIDKVAGSKHKIVALVLPKRASTLQSIVNMKLLKRSGDTHKKKLVLITSETGLLPLAGAVKLHVAKTLQSKPTVPAAPDVPSDEVALEDNNFDSVSADEDLDDLDDEEPEDEPAIDKNKAVGELSGNKATAAAAARPAVQGVEETIEIDDDGEIEDVVPDGDDKKSAKAAKKGDKKLRIPNFNAFRTKLLIGGGVFILLIVGWYIANFVLPRATVTVNTDNVSVTTDLSFTADTSTKEFDAEKAVLPAVTKSVKKTDAEKVPATGKKNVGEKATGTVSLKLTDCSQNRVNVPSGTVVSNGGFNFVLQKDVSFRSWIVGGTCANSAPYALSDTTAVVSVVAQNSGDQYNINGGRAFTVSGFGNVAGYDSSSMSGGTNREVTVVSDADIDAAKEKLADRSKDAANKELKTQLEDDGEFALVDSFAGDSPSISPSPAVGAEASEVTVTSITTYSMTGIKRDDLKSLVVAEAKKQIDTKKQTIASDGLDQATFQLRDKEGTKQQIAVQSLVSTGAQENQEELKKLIAGKKKGDVQDILGTRPGVKSVDVKFSPFWVYKTPTNPSKITIDFKQATNGQDN